MDMVLLYGSVILAGMIVGRTTRTIRQLLFVLTSISFVLVVTSLVIFYHFVFATELLLMFCVFIILFMILILWEREHSISQDKTMKELTVMIYNMLIVYVLSLGGFIIVFRLVYPLENPYILPYFKYVSYPLLFGIVLCGLVWIVRIRLLRTSLIKNLTNSGVWMIILLFLVLFLNAFNIFYRENPYEKGDPQISLSQHINFYESYEFTSTTIPIVEDYNQVRVRDYYFTEDSLYLAVEFKDYINDQTMYVIYECSRDTLELLNHTEIPSFQAFLGEINSTIVYSDYTDNIYSIDGLIDIQLNADIYKFEVVNNKLTILTRYYTDGIHLTEYVYDGDSQQITITEEFSYESTRQLYDLNGDVIDVINEDNIIYEDDAVLFFYATTYDDVYRYQNGEISLFNTIQNYSVITPTKYGILVEFNSNATIYSNDGGLIGQATLYGFTHPISYSVSGLFDVLEDGTFRYVTVAPNIGNEQIEFTYMDLHSPHIPIFLQYYISPYVGLLLLIGLFPFKKQDI